ncbi:antibiotic biosynthesis monooxygenase family protein [Paeniglutamicibacter sp. NPDC091659]|uniref:antibiotic biosynthesis monooxygenase family protein n=1 Tax=Paeniglutamicibacter sp. NPDC091659 TaxID=3364389 RepID=UPI0038151DE6
MGPFLEVEAPNGPSVSLADEEARLVRPAPGMRDIETQERKELLIRTQLTLKPLHGRVQDVLDFYASRGILARSLAQPGCLATEIRVHLPYRDSVVVSAVWESGAAYQAWVDNPHRALDVADLTPMLNHPDGSLGEAEISEIHEYTTKRSGPIHTVPLTAKFQPDLIKM